jgi:hypothetical protein
MLLGSGNVAKVVVEAISTNGTSERSISSRLPSFHTYLILYPFVLKINGDTETDGLVRPGF